jgi:hypothetical protein
VIQILRPRHPPISKARVLLRSRADRGKKKGTVPESTFWEAATARNCLDELAVKSQHLIEMRAMIPEYPLVEHILLQRGSATCETVFEYWSFSPLSSDEAIDERNDYNAS